MMQGYPLLLLINRLRPSLFNQVFGNLWGHVGVNKEVMVYELYIHLS